MKSRLEALYISAQAAQTLVQMPGATPVADELLRSAGFKDAGASGEVIPPRPCRRSRPNKPPWTRAWDRNHPPTAARHRPHG